MTAAIENFETPRLRASRISLEDFDDLYHLLTDPLVAATLGDIPDELQVRQALNRAIEHWDRHGFGIWSFRSKANRQFVGRAGLRHQEIAGQREIELLYTIAASEWRKGLATEMARAIVSVAFEKLHLSEIVAITLATNIASRRVLEHVGFEYERDVSWAGRRHVLYRRFFAKF